MTKFAARNIERIPRISPNDMDNYAVAKRLIDMDERLQAMQNNLGETRADLMMYGDWLKTVQNTVLAHEVSIMNCVPSNERMRVPYMSHQSTAVFESAVSDVDAAADTGNSACAQWPPLAVPYVAILEISKTIMYHFHYDYIRHKYPDAQLLFTDTDSLCYEIITDDVYAGMLYDCEQFDTSDYPLDHPNYSATNKKVLGKFKDETAGKPIIEFVGLKPKMYSILLDKTEKKTAKGISRHVTARDLHHELYKSCLLEEYSMSSTMNVIRSRNQNLYSQTIHKTSLSPYDDKRYVLEDGVSTRAHGHYMNA